MSQLASKIVVRRDGKVLATENQGTFNPGGITRKPERHGGKTYYTEEETPPMLECALLMTRETNVFEMSNITGATVTFETDTGQKMLLRSAFTTEPVTFDAKGRSPLKFSGEAEQM